MNPRAARVHPPTSGARQCGARFHRTLLDEHFRTTWYEPVDEMQADSANLSIELTRWQVSRSRPIRIVLAAMETSTLRMVLATTDLSEGSDEALGSAARLARAEGASLHALHCVPQPVFPYWKGGIDQETRDRWLDAARERLLEQLGRVLGDDVRDVTAVVRLGSPFREITGYATDASADVIVLGPHRPRAVLDDLLGTTADRVLRTLGAPCLLAHAPLTAPVTRLLVATDFSPHARRALDAALDWFGDASRPPLHIDLLHVYAVGSPVYRPFDADALLAQNIEEARSRLPNEANVTFQLRTLTAPLAAEGLAKAVERFPSDLLVLGTHGHGFMARALLGSLASSVARMVRHPILFVPPSGKDQA